MLFSQPGVNNARGNYRFHGFRTGGCSSSNCRHWGSPIADMYLGWLHNINVREGINAPDWRQVAMGAFFNDDWKVTPKLTVNLGVRWEVNRMPWDVNDKMGSYVPEFNKIVLASDRNLPDNFDKLLGDYNLQDRFLTAEEAGFSRSAIQTDWNNLTPCFGFAYRVTNKTVLRAGYGLFVAGTILNPFRNNLGNIFPYTVNPDISPRGVDMRHDFVVSCFVSKQLQAYRKHTSCPHSVPRSNFPSTPAVRSAPALTAGACQTMAEPCCWRPPTVPCG